MRCPLWSKGLDCFLCWEGAKGKRFHKGHRGYRARCKEVKHGDAGMAIKKPTGGSGASRPGRAVATDDVAALFPTIVEFLTLDVYDDGSGRRTATLLLFCEEGLWKLCLSDRDLSRTGWSAGPTIEGALSSMEAALAADAMEWRKAKPTPARR